MYTNTLTSISGDDLLVMPSYGKDIILEVSANNDIFFKKGTITKRFDNLVSEYLDTSFNSLNSQVQYILQEISGSSVKDFITSGISNDLLIKSYDGRDIILEVSGNSEIIFKRGDFSYNLDDLIGGGGGSQSSDYATYNILDITGKIIFTDNSGTSGTSGGNSGSSSNIVLTSISGDIIPSINNTFKLGDVSKNWSNAYIRDISTTNIDVSGKLNVVGATKLANTLEISGNVTFGGSNLYVPSSFTIDPLGHGDNTGTVLINGNLVVQGVTTTINSSVVDISDKMLVLASNASNSLQANGAGFEISGAKVNFLYNDSSATFNSSIGISISGNVVPVTNSVGSLGESGKIWDIAYIRELNVTNFTNSIDGAKIANETITSTQIMNGTILGTDISNDTITSANIRDGSILTADICDNAITFDKLAYNSVGNTRIINLAVTHEKLSSNCVQSHNIVDGTIVDGDISGNANILGSKLANNSITSDKINQANNWTFSQLTSTRANIRDISTTNIEVSGNIVPLRDNSSNLGSSLKRWNYIYVNDLSVNTINGQAYSAGGGGGGGGGSTDLTSITSNVVPSTTNTYNLGSTTNYWNNAYINNLKVSNRVYQEISGDISWSAVNGHYGLAKDAYPSLNPVSSGANAVRSWRTITTDSTISNSQWTAVCWSPELRLFVAVGTKNTGSSVVITSNNGITWTPVPITDTSITLGGWTAVCWSPQLRLFVAGGQHIGGTSLRFMYSNNGTTWNPLPDAPGRNVYNIRWSPELGIFLAMAQGAMITSSDGYTWIENYMPYPLNNSNWEDACWSPELGLFVAVAYNEIKVMISKNGINWTRVDIPASVFGGQWTSITWSSQLGIFVAVSRNTGGTTARVMTSRDAITWILADIPEEAQHTWASVCWSPELRIFIGTLLSAWDGSYRILTSLNGTNWKFVPVGTPLISDTLSKVIWCPELGIFIALKGSSGNDQINISSLKGRPPTSYNVFDSNFNSIDETGKWSFQNLGVTGTFTNTSDDRLKHNEIVISNGLAIIDSLTPKFYQKTLTMLDASYNGDLSGQAWTYEAGVIAQELLQISDLSFVVSGGNYYQERYIYSRPTNDPSNVDYDPSLNIYDISNANYTISNNLITQAYNVNYNSVFVYGLAAIKELHQKVKVQETSISTLQTVLLEQQATINSLLTRIQALEPNASQ
jgi:hypothetical protein